MVGINDSKIILIIGGASGIGQALAYALLDLPSKPTVIVGDKRKDRLDDMVGERLETVHVDVNVGPVELKQFVDDVTAKYSEIDTVILCAGIQRGFDFTQPTTVDPKVIIEEFNINYIAPVTLITYLLPHLLKLSEAGQPCYIIPVTSGLAMAPKSDVPNYCATKAALHSFATSLSLQLSETNVKVMEIMPPLVESELHEHRGLTNKVSKFWMPLKEFTEKAIAGLQTGNLHHPIGVLVDDYNKFNEKGKLEQAAALHKSLQSGGVV